MEGGIAKLVMVGQSCKPATCVCIHTHMDASGRRTDPQHAVPALTSSQSAGRSVFQVVLRDGPLAVFATQGEVLK